MDETDRCSLRVSYSDMNVLCAAQAPIGSAGLSILPFGNGAERMLENKEIGLLHSRHKLQSAWQTAHNSGLPRKELCSPF